MTKAAMAKPLSRARRFARRLRGDTSGLALVEFAFAAPLVLGMGMLGTETAFLVITHLQVSQIAMQVADNASRVGEEDVLNARKVYERDVAATLIGAEKLGANIDIFDQGRVIVSSLQQNAQGGQWIAWQRCRGAKVYNSTYGVEGQGAIGTSFPGMGSPGRYITASTGTAVMFVEVAYDFESPTPLDLFEGREIVYTAAFNVRDNRDLTRLYSGGPVARCNTYSSARPS
ncbi:pilus assembly protein [Porphyrobacter sp. YT40]|uniref:TadE/TadG family type IV pilus assembly protein n=1 Tax=Porphyrobacter sp. YT40 TaxID=2547601 RepID=UPI001144BFDE|nr:pilus assembly protein [Porphyrobacter sp. YT40]QDH34826.1 pilus assembly protein [Porphyrobacter sp. YT40]